MARLYGLSSARSGCDCHQVERVITGDLEMVDGELRPSAEAIALAEAEGSPPPTV